MGYTSQTSGRRSRARERYLKQRRRQRAVLSAAALLGLALVCLVILVVVGVRSCSLDIGFSNQVQRDPRDPRWALEVRAHDFKLAPWLTDIGPDRIYVAQDTSLAEPGLEGLPVNLLAAYPLVGSEPTWETTVNEELDEFHFSAGRLVGYRLFRADPPRIYLTVYDALTGAHDWDLEIPGVEDGGIICGGEAAILGYCMADGYRLAAYNLTNQAKAWGMRLPLDGMMAVDPALGDMGHLQLHDYDELVAYQLMNVVGIVSKGTGRRIREFASTGYIHDLVIDQGDQLCYLLATGNQYNTYVVQLLPVNGGSPQDIYRFETDCPVNQILMHAGDGKLVLAYTMSSADGAGPRTKLVAFDRYSADPEITHELEGVAGDLVPVRGLSGEYLVAVNADVVPDEAGLPRGWGELWRVRLADRVVWESHHFRRPILSTIPFKEDCIVLLRGGEVYSYLAPPDGVKRLRKARFPVLAATLSQDERHLVVFSWTEQCYNYQPGQPAQLIIYE